MEQRYSNYKSSGVDWIGEIPAHWESLRLGMIGVFSSSGIDKKIEDGEPIVKMVNYTDIIKSRTHNPIISKEVDFMVVSTPQSKIAEHTLKKGDLVFIPSSETDEDLGVSSLIDFDDEIVYSYHILRFKFNKEVNHYFKKYLGNHYGVLKQFSEEGKGTTRQIIGRNVFRNTLVVLPPLPEQEQIVKYLDEKTSQIDNLISITEKKIELLKQKRTSLINEVVTKGLNRDVEMKDSGVEWIGEIPTHWRMNKVKRNTYVKGRIGWKGLRSEDFIDEGPFLITGTDFNKDGTINYENIYHVSQERYDEDIFIQLQDEDVLITKDGTIGKVVYVDKLNGFTCLNSGIFVTRPLNGEYISRFFFNLLRSNVFSVFIDYNSGGSTIQHLYQNVFDNFNFPIPPISEQKQIIKYLDAKNAEIDNLVSIEKRRIDTLKEYRKSLISEVVTGKIKVTKEESTIKKSKK